MMEGHNVLTLVVFIVSTRFVICPVSIPTRVRSIPRVHLNLNTAPILAIAILWASRCIDSAVIGNGIVGTGGIKPYNILVLFLSMSYMGITLATTGITGATAFWLSNTSGSNGRKLYFYFYAVLTLLSIPLGNNPVILSGTASVVDFTSALRLEPMPWLMSEFATANTASMVLSVGSLTNVIICEGFGVNDAAFTAYTILPFLACNIVCFGALAGQYHSDRHVPRKLDRRFGVDPRSALRDVTGAWVGSVIFGSALIACLVVSFFGIDVWKISLPFSVTKLFFDLAWDHYLFTYRRVADTESILMRRSDRGEGLLMETPSREPQYQRSLGLTKLPKHQLTCKWRKLFISYDTISKSAPRLIPRTPFRPPSQHNRPQSTARRVVPEGGTLCHSTPTPRDTVQMPLDSLASRTLIRTRTLNHELQNQHAVELSSLLELRSIAGRATPETTTDGSIPLPLDMLQTIPQSPAHQTLITRIRAQLSTLNTRLHMHFPTFFNAVSRLPFSLVPFAFSQSILIQALVHQGWVDIFADWLVRATNKEMYSTIWLVGVLGVILCNVAGTSIGATILLTKIVNTAALPSNSSRAAAIALAVASNVGAVSFSFSASLGGLLWKEILARKKVFVKQRDFAYWNLFPVLVMTATGLAVVCAEMAVLYRSSDA